MTTKAVLVLEDGRVFTGTSFGAVGQTLGELLALPEEEREVLLDTLTAFLASDGSPTRTFCYVADAVTGLLRLLTRGRPGEAYNIGGESDPDKPPIEGEAQDVTEIRLAQLTQRLDALAAG